HWLDTALVDGRVVDGRAVVSGDLDDWPFRAGERGRAAKGLFEANGRLDGAVVKFQPDWPAADHLDAEVSFVGNGFTVDGRGARGRVSSVLLEANGRLHGPVVKYQPDRPAADHLDAEVSYVGNGFTVGGRGAIAGVEIPRLEAGIADFSEADLRVDADAKTDAG